MPKLRSRDPERVFLNKKKRTDAKISPIPSVTVRDNSVKPLPRATDRDQKRMLERNRREAGKRGMFRKDI